MSAICTTVKEPHQFDTYITYHLKLGIDKIYVFIDDPRDESTIDICRKYFPRVLTIVCNQSLINKQKEMFPGNPHFNTYYEVMSRQILNAKYAILLARQEGIKYMFHTDSDELIHIKSDKSLSSILNEMYTLGNYYLRLQNYEISPEHGNYENCFTEGVYFKTDLPTFVAYANGKSAVYIGGNSSIDVNGVHTFQTPWSHQLCPDIIVLHYVSCNFSEFLKKYKMLGNFGNWWGKVPISIKFHTNARDVVAKCEKTKEECEREALIFYRNNHIYNPNSSHLIKIDKVKKVLQGTSV